MRQTETAALRPRKPSRLVAIISTGVLMFTILAAILLGVIMPKSAVVGLADTKIKSIAPIEEDVYVATTDGKITRMDDAGNVKNVLDLAAFGAEHGITVGETVHVQTQSTTKNIWASTSYNYLFKIQEMENGDFVVLDYTKLGDSVMSLVEKNDYLYLLEKVGLFGCFKKYDLSKPLNEGLMSMGHLYKPEETGNAITLTPAKNLGILSFEIIEKDGVEYAYIMHTSGLLRFTTDCSQNDWKVKYDAMYPVEYEKEYAEAVAEKVEEGKPEAVAKAEVDASLSSVKKAANKAVVKALGLENPEAFIREEINKVNAKLPAFQRISKVVFRDTDFARSPAMKILRNQQR